MQEEKRDSPTAEILVLSPQQRLFLLQIARDAINQHVCYGRTPVYQSDEAVLNRKAGVFVSLRQEESLRGCIGRIVGDKPLVNMVGLMAIKAATMDPRFPPVTAVELPALHIEISILSPIQELIDAHTLVIGRQGLLIEGHGRRGLLLPHVPTSFHWNQEQFLEGICAKAGLPATAWKSPDVKLFTFTTLMFEDE